MSKAKLSSGYIALQSAGGKIELRNLSIKTNPKQTNPAEAGLVCFFDTSLMCSEAEHSQLENSGLNGLRCNQQFTHMTTAH